MDGTSLPTLTRKAGEWKMRSSDRKQHRFGSRDETTMLDILLKERNNFRLDSSISWRTVPSETVS